ncbi:MAG: hypothetical protein Barrevirus13_6 [Barrevirus sp.]|uniref:Uncharacterized protein n=1 Tax=Barrevirus sp. TaxID=2487763 RepID=A0A3G4ZQG6_9VIRU|nr:MAG: hypothetical protein Barrevirus13_6 [Barrevirus sp.]
MEVLKKVGRSAYLLMDNARIQHATIIKEY